MKVIYQLVDPIYKVPFYVGQTARPNRRLLMHVAQDSRDRHRNRLKYWWVQRIIDDGAYPVMEALEYVVDDAEVLEREAFWMVDRLAEGLPLTNANFETCIRWGLAYDQANWIARLNIIEWASEQPSSPFIQTLIYRWKPVLELKPTRFRTSPRMSRYSGAADQE